jgi:hypothetical protein
MSSSGLLAGAAATPSGPKIPPTMEQSRIIRGINRMDRRRVGIEGRDLPVT